MPECFVRWGLGWQNKHPGWTMLLWTEKEIEGFENLSLLSKCGTLAQQADIVRYEALMRYGGVYLDTDMECVRSIEPLIDSLDFFSVWQRPEVVSNAIFGGVQGHSVFLELVRRSREEFAREPWNVMGPVLFTKVVRADPTHTIFERKTFIPWTRVEYEGFPRHPMEGLEPPPESYAINHRSSVWHKASTTPIGNVS